MRRRHIHGRGRADLQCRVPLCELPVCCVLSLSPSLVSHLAILSHCGLGLGGGEGGFAQHLVVESEEIIIFGGLEGRKQGRKKECDFMEFESTDCPYICDRNGILNGLSLNYRRG